MELYRIVIVFMLIITSSHECYGEFAFSAHILEHIKTNTSVEDQRMAVAELIRRIIPQHSDLFVPIVDSGIKQNSFKILKTGGMSTVSITGSTGVAASKGFYHYLKYFCGCHISWDGDQLELPQILPNVNVTIEAPSSIIYYQNVCTWSYSFTWWTWKDWRRHIDWMALQGITLSLAPFQEDLWTEIYSEYNLTQYEIDSHLSGPGFFAWQRMGNIRGWGGPLTQNFMDFSATLQSQVVKQMRRLGMIVALPAFAGHLPIQFKQLFPHAKLTSVEVWNGFPYQFASPLFLDPIDPLFLEIGSKFVTKVIARYGTDHIYFSDPFNEVQPHSTSSKYLAGAAEGIFKAMAKVDPLAVWLLQGWMFLKNPLWSDRAIQAFLTAIPIGRVLVLDLQSEQYPQYTRTNSYYGQPFVWCMLSNFGGTLGMLGSVELVYERILETRSDPNMTMMGTGITPEGINQNYGLYEFALELGWNKDINDTDKWFRRYSTVRYGSDDGRLQDAWSIFRQTVYSFKGLELMRGKYTFNRRPSMKLQPWVWYNETFFNDGVELLLAADSTSKLFLNDVVDVTRQFLQNTADRIYLTVMDTYHLRNRTSLQVYSQMFQQLLKDLNRLLRSDEHFLLGRWLESAKALGQTSLERQKYEYNARNQITLWGPQGQIVDYANKQWAGVVEDFFLPRWRMFLSEMEAALKDNRTLNETKVRSKIFRLIELAFSTDNKRYPVAAEGNALEIARELYRKWSALSETLKILPKSGNK
ncbi:alpha-N-acetylglucosaminidase [Toxorhynchites rutilus septentrionalis]|uniref:alpha-N-acetylglucosaminidase n=1 Tax=Toxorhynchites rutilus septentrionalis TaxID=329112 RepID=UPI002479DA85|nr:alpha-N-acetylglucosaminidase [Toxorhynchites rutilus septentrionalis]